MKTKIAKTILLAVLAGTVSAGTLNEGPGAPGKPSLERQAASERPKRSYFWKATKPDRRGIVKFSGLPKHKPGIVKFSGKSKYKPDDFMFVCVWCGKTCCHKCVKTAQDAQCSTYGHSWSAVPAKKSGKHKH